MTRGPLIAIAFVACVFGIEPAVASAATGSIKTFKSNTSGGIAFTVNNITTAALAGSQTYSFSLAGTVGSSPGSITITAPTMTGNAGNTIPVTAYTVTCTSTVDTYGSFQSSGAMPLSSSAVTCGTLSSSSNVNVTFTVLLTLNCTTSALYAFPSAATYTNSNPLTVTVTV